ncbi:multidrug effflux MFS transporter [Flexibacterium corallicola]|uniref:multidrug effflux MFS transporter n=1 Tax=Flexibacterium corallicola TaxID=3037259 RepID=UPI00286F06EB|nr:multidrug effflux MFS transporter [Pseudovibrio sp. M1P-2-3]
MSSSTVDHAAASPHSGIGFLEFIALLAALMALNALSIDIMLPALPLIGEDLAVYDPNNRQLLITAYLTGLAVASLVFGPLSDWLGRKKVLLFGLALFTVGTVFSATAETFETMLIARVIQGVGAASPRVMSISMVRDWYSGRQMGRVMSLAMTVFMIAPIVAPSIGQSVLLVGPWRWVFFLLTVVGTVILLWSALRLPESLPPENRRKIGFRSVLSAYKSTLTIRLTFGYMLAASLVMGCLFGFINSSQQIFMDVFKLEESFPLIFGFIALSLAASSFINAQLVERWGLRKLSHAAVLCFTLVNIINAIIGYTEHASLWNFVLLQFVAMFFFGFIGANFNTMAMEPLGKIAGTGSAMLGFFTTMVGALLGAGIGHFFDHSTLPYTLSCAILGLAATLVVFITEKGRLFNPHYESNL